MPEDLDWVTGGPRRLKTAVGVTIHVAIAGSTVV
jgi:hypothetical protein